MRFCRIKKEQPCKGCSSTMMPGEEAVVIRIYDGIPLCFHIACFLPWNDDKFHSRYWEWKSSRTDNKKPKPKMGRPRKYVNPIEAARLRAHITYYKGIGSEEKVQRLQEELAKLRA